jgi:hypothetical protein
LTIGSVDVAVEPIEDKEIVLIIRPNSSQAAKDVVARLAMVLEDQYYKTTIFIWGSEMTALKGKQCLALMELDNSIFMNLNERDFELIKTLILGAKSTFWVVGHGDPSAAMIAGLARVVRNETPGISLRTFHYEQYTRASSEKVGELIAKVFTSKTSDNEFMVKDGVINVSRVEEDAALNNEIELLLSQRGRKVTKMPLGQADGPQKLCVLTPGLLDSLTFEVDKVAQTNLSAEMIEIKVKATALQQVYFPHKPP